MSDQNQNELGHDGETLGDVASLDNRADLEEGTRIHRYLILGLIGKGGMGAVYKAYDPELDRKIAIKMLTLSPQEGETASVPQVRLMREAQALARLNHPNVVSVFDVGTYQQGVYIAMEYVEGKTLRDWIKEDQPVPSEIIQVMLAAGRGLQAAHSQGIAHRDFKPENLLVGQAGQVKVLDFGLARAADFEANAGIRRDPQTRSESNSTEQVLSQPLTQAGARIGTLVYMAPEHFLQQELDEKTDQFSFSVTLAEALYGQRPFVGKTLDELAQNVTEGRIQLPTGKNVPRWIQEIIFRGLSVSKVDRYDSMELVLQDLAHDPEIQLAAKRKKRLLAIAIVVFALLPFGVWNFFFRVTTLCTGASDKVDAVWNQAVKGKLEGSFRASKLSYAGDTLTRVLRRMDDYAASWTDAYAKACQATHVRGEQSFEILDLRMGCLRRRLGEFWAMAEVFSTADKSIVKKAVQAASGLSEIADCSNVDLLLASQKQRFADQVTRQTSQPLFESLTKVKAWRKSGQFQRAYASVNKILEEARRRKLALLMVGARLVLGRTLIDMGRFEEATEILENAFFEADVASDDLKALQAANELIFAAGCRLADHKAGERWYWLARMKRQRLGLGVNHPEVADSFHYMGSLQLLQGRYEKALAAYQQAISIREKVLSADHPDLSSTYNNIGIVYRRRGKLEQALDAYSKTLAIQNKALGPKHPNVGGTLNNIGLVYYDQGKLQLSLEAYQQAIAILEESQVHNHPYLANSLNNVGEIYLQQNRYAQALGVLSRALAIRETLLGSQHPKVAIVLGNLGGVYLKLGHFAKAQDHYTKSLAVRESTLGKDHPVVANSLVGLGELALKQKRVSEARAHFERLAAICEKTTCDSHSHCSALLALVQMQKNRRDSQKQAQELGARARLVCQQKPLLQKRLVRVDQWLKKLDKKP